MAKKYSKNLQKVQDMLDGNNQGKIQSGYMPDNISHEIGDIWTDSDGVRWEQKNGYKSKLTKVNVGMFSKQCKDCNRNCSKESKHLDTWKRFDRCFYCQMNYEVMLKSKKIGGDNNKWFFWVKLQRLKRWDSIDKEIEQYIFDKHNESDSNLFDMSVANAISNANVELTINKNKTMTE